MTTPIQTDLGAFYEGLNTQEMIQETRRWLGQQPDDTTRYTNADIIIALNYAQTRFAKLTMFMLVPVVIICKSGRMNYRLPYTSLRVKSGRYYTGSGATSYYELKILRDMRQMQRLDSTMRGTPGTPTYLFPTYRAGNVAQVGLNPIPNVDGEVWVGSDYGVLTSATGFTNVGNITGLHKTGFPASAFLVDSAGRDLTTLGALVGYPIYNVTDGSVGLITAIGDQAATNDKISVTLAGGTNNYWSPDDSFQIPMSEYGVVMDAAGAETYTFNSYLGTIYDIRGNTGNLVLDVARKPLPLSVNYLTMFSEVPAEYHEAVIAFAVYWLGRSAYKGVVQKEKAQEGLEIFVRYVQEYKTDGEVAEETDVAIEDRLGELLD